METHSTHTKFKVKYPDTIVLIGVEGIYHTYGEDAENIHLALTAIGREDSVTYADGHASCNAMVIQQKLGALVKQGLRIALCETLKTQAEYKAAQEAVKESDKAKRKEFKEIDNLLGGRLTAMVERLKSQPKQPVQPQLSLF